MQCLWLGWHDMARYDTYAVRPLTGYADRPKARAPLLDVKYHTGWKQISANESLGAFFERCCKESLTLLGFTCFSRWIWSSRCGDISYKCYRFGALLETT